LPSMRGTTVGEMLMPRRQMRLRAAKTAVAPESSRWRKESGSSNFAVQVNRLPASKKMSWMTPSGVLGVK